MADDDVQREVDNLEPCTQYVALGRTLGGHSSSVDPVLFTGCDLQVPKGKEPCYTKFSGRNQHLMMLTTSLPLQTSEPSLLGEPNFHLLIWNLLFFQDKFGSLLDTTIYLPTKVHTNFNSLVNQTG